MEIRDFVERSEAYLLELVRGNSHRPADVAARAGLFCLSRVYRALVEVRMALYRHRIVRPRSLGCLVVSIGNLTCGGTGKTPVVEVFARILTRQGRRVAILSRGYRSKSKPLGQRIMDRLLKRPDNVPPRVVSDGERLLLNSEMAGDEPYMLAANLRDVAVLVDKDRVKSGRYAINHLDVDTLILDDGFQYLPLKPQLNILLVDATSPFDNHHLLPRGLMREPIKHLRRADYVFLTKSNGGAHLRHLKRFIKRHNHRAEIIECTHRPQYFREVYTQERAELAAIQGKRVAAISGIAQPKSFETFLESLGGNLVYAEQFADHHRFKQQEVMDFVNAADKHQADWIVTTEKDAVRFPMLERRDVPIFYLRVEIDILSGGENFAEAISRICFSPVPQAEPLIASGAFDDTESIS